MQNVATKMLQLDARWEVWALAFSPDTSALAGSSPNSDEVAIWEWRLKRLKRTLHTPRTGTINGLRYSPAGDLLVAAHNVDQSGALIRIWKTDSWQVADDIVDPIGGSQFFGIAFSPDGHSFFRSQKVGRGSGDNLAVYSTQTWRRLWRLQSAPLQPETLAVSADGGWAAIAGSSRLLRGEAPYLQPQLALIDVTSKHVAHIFDVLADGFLVQFLVWNPIGDRLAVGGRPVFAGSRLTRATIQILSAESGQILGEYTSPNATHVQALTYSPNSKYLIVAWNGLIEIWDALHVTLLQTIPEDAGAVTVSRDSQYMAVGGIDKKITIWQLQ